MSTETALPALPLAAYFEPREAIQTLWVVSTRALEPDQRDLLHPIEVRRCFAGRSVTMHSATCEAFVDIEQARLTLAGRGLECIGRMPDDEPHVIEVWS